MFTAGLLHDLGKIILGHEQLPTTPDLYRKPSDAESVRQEQELFGCTHAEVGAALLERWKLPTQIVVAVRHHHEPQQAQGMARIAACVTLGNFLAHSEDRPQILERPEFKENLTLLGLSADNLKRWAERMNDHRNLLSSMCHLPI